MDGDEYIIKLILCLYFCLRDSVTLFSLEDCVRWILNLENVTSDFRKESTSHV